MFFKLLISSREGIRTSQTLPTYDEADLEAQRLVALGYLNPEIYRVSTSTPPSASHLYVGIHTKGQPK